MNLFSGNQIMKRRRREAQETFNMIINTDLMFQNHMKRSLIEFSFSVVAALIPVSFHGGSCWSKISPRSSLMV